MIPRVRGKDVSCPVAHHRGPVLQVGGNGAGGQVVDVKYKLAPGCIVATEELLRRAGGGGLEPDREGEVVVAEIVEGGVAEGDILAAAVEAEGGVGRAVDSGGEAGIAYDRAVVAIA